MALHLPPQLAQHQPAVTAEKAKAQKTSISAQMQALEELNAQVVQAVDALAAAYMAVEDAQAKKLMDTFTKAKSALQSIAGDEFAPDEQAFYTGTEKKAIFSKKAQTKAFSQGHKLALLEKLGPELFCSVITVSTTELKRVLSEGEIEQYCTMQWGSRSFQGITDL